jgi:hypothetical protein
MADDTAPSAGGFDWRLPTCGISRGARIPAPTSGRQRLRSMCSTLTHAIAQVMRREAMAIPGYERFKSYLLRLLGFEQTPWVRLVMNRETQKLVEQLNPSELSVLEISGDAWRGRCPFKAYRSVGYPEYDICSDPLPDRFDLVILEQVLEHVLWPCRAGRNIYTMLNKDGHALITVPFMVRVHPSPTDCTRWTEIGLMHFLAECGFPLGSIQTGSWGNRECVKSNFVNWPRYNRWLHSLRNEAEFPCVVWALAGKSQAPDPDARQ